MIGRRSVSRLLVLAAAIVALMLAFAASAFAGPNVPILSFSDLRSALAASPDGHLTGYMRTVVADKVGDSSDITTIPLTVTGVPKSGGADDDLIMFEATGALIAKYGGVVAGMSGSPVYLDDGRLIGAVSYGDYFTLGGTGLATPIEAMAELETSYASTAVLPLSTPIITSGGVVNKIIVSPNPQDYAGAAAAGAFVAKPLASVFIGGLSPSSTLYKALAKDFEARGVKIVSLDTRLASGSDGSAPFSTEMTAGASVAALVSRGDMWVGGVGTITYVNGDDVLAFGHPAYWSGVTSLYLANAWVEGVWPNSFEPYKVADPGAVRGTITQDRKAGILGKTDVFPDETAITAHAINEDDPGAETTSAVYVPRQLLSNGFADSTLVSSAAYVAASKLFDQQRAPGSARTTTTVDVADGHGHTYEVRIPNYTNSTNDIATDSTYDIADAISSLQAVLGWGTEDLRILSVDLTGEYSAKQAQATIVGVEAPNGLHVGANRIDVKALVYGDPTTETVTTMLTVPSGTSLSGSLKATALGSASDQSSSSDSGDSGDSGSSSGSSGSTNRETIAQIVDDLNATLPNNTIVVTFQPSLSGGDSSSPAQFPSTDPVSRNVTTLWPASGAAYAAVTTIDAAAQPSVISYGDFTDIAGDINGPSKPCVVWLYAKTAGSSVETLVATQTATSIDGDLVFDFPIDQAFTNTTYRVHVDGTNSSTAADANVSLRVKAIAGLGLSASHIRRGRTVTLTASVHPASSAGGTVVFEQLVGRSWRKIASRTLGVSGSSSKAKITWKPGRGAHKVRVRYLGGLRNYATTSATKTITVK